MKPTSSLLAQRIIKRRQHNPTAPQKQHRPNQPGSPRLGAVAIIALAAGSYGLYQQNQATKAQLFASEQRIAELERTLSATGEEMGESAGAMRAKLSELTEKTDELWSQMDKLWASAWRRNQSEIKELQKQTNNIASTNNSKRHAIGCRCHRANPVAGAE